MDFANEEKERREYYSSVLKELYEQISLDNRNQVVELYRQYMDIVSAGSKIEVRKFEKELEAFIDKVAVISDSDKSDFIQ